MKIKKLILTQGIPASGKSTFAKELAKKEGFYRVNKDDLREMFHSGTYSKDNEKIIVETERNLVELAMQDGRDIIVDNTHLQNKKTLSNQHIDFYVKLAKDYDYKVEIKVFPITKEEAIKRDASRTDKEPVGEDVFDRMEKYSVFPPVVPSNPVLKPYDNGLKTCVICDIDGTIAFMNGKRGPYDYTKVYEDDINEMLRIHLALLEHSGVKVIYLSGRDSVCRDETLRWFRDKFGEDAPELYMRANKDTRNDGIVKEELYREHIEGKYNVLAVFDDRDRVVKKWRELGLLCHQIYWGDF